MKFQFRVAPDVPVATSGDSRYILRLMSSLPFKSDRFSRRRFLVGSASAPFVAALPLGKPAQSGRSETLGLGFIGLGNRGFQLLRMVADDPGIDVISCGDLWTPHFDRLREFGMKRSFYTPMWIKVLHANNLDGVLVALPDHLQLQVVEEALRRGKKVYVEPPATCRWDEWSRLKAQAAENSAASLYWGSQQLSSAAAETARQWLAEGRIGTLLSIEGEATGYWGGFSPVPPGATLQERNWKWFHDKGPERDFDAHRFFTWGGYSEYSAGITMRHFQHLLAAIHSAHPLPAPSKVSSLGGNHRLDQRWDLPDRVFSRIEFSEGPPFHLSAIEQEGPPELLVTLRGSEGWIEYSQVTVRQFRAARYLEPAFAWPKQFRTAYAREIGDGTEDIPASRQGTPPPVEEVTVEADGTRLHLTRFFESIRAGRTGVLHEAQGNAELIGHLARISLETGAAAAPGDAAPAG